MSRQKTLVKTVIFILLLQAALLLTSCDYGNIIGTYCCGKQESETSIYIALYSDGKCAMYGRKMPLVYVTYEEVPDSSGQYVIQIGDKQYYAEYKHKQLVIMDEGLAWEYKKIGNTPAIPLEP